MNLVSFTDLILANYFFYLTKCRIHAGMMGYKFFMFERSVTLEYAMAIVDQTVNIMMSTDETWLSEMGGGI
jgi:hypothetical protein